MINDPNSQVNAFPAPWQLAGEGFILAYRFPQPFVEKHGFLPTVFANSYIGGFGAVMLVDYQQSEAGPYRELLFTPGQFQVNGRRFYSITKIYVSTWESVINGRQNWGIPKEFAEFDFTTLPDGSTQVKVAQNEQVFADFVLETGKLSLPVTTAPIPSSLRTIIEPWGEKTYFTAPNGSGQVKPARLLQAKIDAAYFPNVGLFQPVACFRASKFKLEFPTATISEGINAN